MVSILPIAKQYASLMAQWMAQLEDELSPANDAHVETMRRANFVVRNKAFTIDDYYEQYNRLSMSISGTTIAHVELDFNMERIYCTCKETQPCHHVVAAMMVLYQYSYSLQEWVTNWRSSKQTLLHVEHSIAAWKKIAEATVNKIMVTHSIETYALASLDFKVHERLAVHAPLEREWKVLYQLYTELYVLYAGWERLDLSFPRSETMFMYFLTRKHERIMKLLQQLRHSTPLFEMDAFFAEIEQMLHDLLFDYDFFDTQRFSLYCYYWAFVQRSAKAREVGLARLADCTCDTEFAELFFAMLAQDEKQVLATTEQSLLHSGYYLTIARTIAEPKSCYTHLLKLALPNLKEHAFASVPPSMFKLFADGVMALYRSVELTEHEEQMLYGSLDTYGLQYYAQSLIEKQRYRDWVALQMLHVTSLGHAEMNGLKEVLVHDAGATLPLYHMLAMMEVEQKSRTHYKQAVRIWKMMKSAAKKANKLAYFERYIESMQRQFKRLRALQQEMEKGKLLP